MTIILRVDASARTQDLVSRTLGDHLERRLVARMPDARIVRRDLAANPLPHIESNTIAGYYTPPDQMTDALRRATALSDELIGELRSADILILTSPMYNFSIPSALKAWIDQIVRIGHTFSYDGASFAGLLGSKKAYIALAHGAGGYQAGQAFAAANFLDPYLRFMLSFLGITEISVFPVEATTAGPDIAAANTEAVVRSIENVMIAA